MIEEFSVRLLGGLEVNPIKTLQYHDRAPADQLGHKMFQIMVFLAELFRFMEFDGNQITIHPWVQGPSYRACDPHRSTGNVLGGDDLPIMGIALIHGLQKAGILRPEGAWLKVSKDYSLPTMSDPFWSCPLAVLFLKTLAFQVHNGPNRA